MRILTFSAFFFLACNPTGSGESAGSEDGEAGVHLRIADYSLEVVNAQEERLNIHLRADSIAEVERRGAGIRRDPRSREAQYPVLEIPVDRLPQLIRDTREDSPNLRVIVNPNPNVTAGILFDIVGAALKAGTQYVVINHPLREDVWDSGATVLGNEPGVVLWVAPDVR